MDPLNHDRHKFEAGNGAMLFTARPQFWAGLALFLFVLAIVLRDGWLAAAATGALGWIGRGWRRFAKAPFMSRLEAHDSRASAGVNDVRPFGEEHASGLSEQFARLQSVAVTDSLTGLLNRAGLEAFVQHHLQSGARASQHCLMFIDMDGFKQVNDALGHSQGDRLLILLAERLKIVAHHCFPDRLDKRDVNIAVARFGGDEFVIFVANAGSGRTVEELANRVVRIMSDPFQLGSKSVQISASIGVAFAPEHGNDFRELIRNADVAMYQAKTLGKNRWEYFREALLKAAREAEREENEVRDAIVRGEFELYFQPMFDARTMQICAAEALLRWNHPTRGLLSPSDFFPAIDRANLTATIDEWVIDNAVSKIADLERAGIPLMLAVNVSPSRLENPEFPAFVESVIENWQCTPERLQIEVTEDAAVPNPEINHVNLAKLTEIGVSVAIDDFGTGYSKLANLMMLRVSCLKIDQSLLQDIEHRSEAYILVQTIINLANSLGFQAVAEGVETEKQLQVLLSMGCDVFQGFLFSKPVSFEQLKMLHPSFPGQSAKAGMAATNGRGTASGLDPDWGLRSRQVNRPGIAGGPNS